jgi:hypothetical protein
MVLGVGGGLHGQVKETHDPAKQAARLLIGDLSSALVEKQLFGFGNPLGIGGGQDEHQ